VLGGVTGALVGLGVPEIEAKVYEGKLHSGSLLMSVHTDNAEERKRAEDAAQEPRRRAHQREAPT
jgi:small nuclear ribonucleoprotein (snRNP)-like protein